MKKDDGHKPGYGLYGCWDPYGKSDIERWWEHSSQIAHFTSWVRMWIGLPPIVTITNARRGGQRSK